MNIIDVEDAPDSGVGGEDVFMDPFRDTGEEDIIVGLSHPVTCGSSGDENVRAGERVGGVTVVVTSDFVEDIVNGEVGEKSLAIGVGGGAQA